jgi:hypothetical protein
MSTSGKIIDVDIKITLQEENAKQGLLGYEPRLEIRTDIEKVGFGKSCLQIFEEGI